MLAFEGTDGVRYGGLHPTLDVGQVSKIYCAEIAETDPILLRFE